MCNIKMKKVFVFLILCIFLSVGVLAEDVNKVGDWWGTVTINGVENNGAVVSAYINNVHVGSAVVGQYTPKYYLIHIEGNVGDVISFKVSGVQATTTVWSSGNHRLDLAVNYTPSSPSSESGGRGKESSSSPPISSSSSISSSCTEKWQCSEWSECASPGVQTRICTDTNDCGTTLKKPSQSQDCKLTTTQTSTNFLTGAVTGVGDFVKSPVGIVTFSGLVVLAALGVILLNIQKKINLTKSSENKLNK